MRFRLIGTSCEVDSSSSDALGAEIFAAGEDSAEYERFELVRTESVFWLRKYDKVCGSDLWDFEGCAGMGVDAP